MARYYTSTPQNPYHLSIGAVVVNDDKKILCHHYTQFGEEEYDTYLLMKETMHPHESIEQTLHRGLLEEFGAKGEITAFLGSLVTSLPREGVMIQKTTLYFLVKFLGKDESWRSEEDKAVSIVEWHTPEFLIEKMKEQTKHFNNRSTLDESEILKRVNTSLQKKRPDTFVRVARRGIEPAE